MDEWRAVRAAQLWRDGSDNAPTKRVRARCRTSQGEIGGVDGVTGDPLSVTKLAKKRRTVGGNKSLNSDEDEAREEVILGG